MVCGRAAQPGCGWDNGHRVIGSRIGIQLSTRHQPSPTDGARAKLALRDQIIDGAQGDPEIGRSISAAQQQAVWGGACVRHWAIIRPR